MSGTSCTESGVSDFTGSVTRTAPAGPPKCTCHTVEFASAYAKIGRRPPRRVRDSLNVAAILFLRIAYEIAQRSRTRRVSGARMGTSDRADLHHTSGGVYISLALSPTVDAKSRLGYLADQPYLVLTARELARPERRVRFGSSSQRAKYLAISDLTCRSILCVHFAHECQSKMPMQSPRHSNADQRRPCLAHAKSPQRDLFPSRLRIWDSVMCDD